MSNKNKLESNNYEQEGAFKKVVLGMFFGAVVGVTAGILLAPKPGKESRQDFAENAKKAAEKIKETTSTIKMNIQDNQDIIPKKMKFTYSSSKNSDEELDEELEEE